MDNELEQKLRKMLQPISKEVEDNLINEINESVKINRHLEHKILVCDDGNMCIGSTLEQFKNLNKLAESLIKYGKDILEEINKKY